MYVKNGLPAYEGDGFIHAGLAAGGAVNPPIDDANAGRGIRELEQQARRMRGEAVAALLGKFIAWLRRKAMQSRSAALDEYLSRSTSLADIERRLREVERNGSFLPG
jgi:hypothetical protein